MTMNKGTKVKGGWIGIKNLSKVNGHCLTVNTVMKAKETLQIFVENPVSTHKTLNIEDVLTRKQLKILMLLLTSGAMIHGI